MPPRRAVPRRHIILYIFILCSRPIVPRTLRRLQCDQLNRAAAVSSSSLSIRVGTQYYIYGNNIRKCYYVIINVPRKYGTSYISHVRIFVLALRRTYTNFEVFFFYFHLYVISNKYSTGETRERRATARVSIALTGRLVAAGYRGKRFVCNVRRNVYNIVLQVDGINEIRMISMDIWIFDGYFHVRFATNINFVIIHIGIYLLISTSMKRHRWMDEVAQRTA